jgi:hypothetical protein
MKKTGPTILTAAVLILILLLAGCLPRTAAEFTPDPQPAGFLMGIWHGWIAPVSLIVKLFDHSVTIFDSRNTGFWYDFGFYIAILGGFGGFGLVRRKKRESDR